MASRLVIRSLVLVGAPARVEEVEELLVTVSMILTVTINLIGTSVFMVTNRLVTVT